MSNQATLSYSGRMELETNNDGTLTSAATTQLHDLLDDAIAVYEGDVVSLETAVAHFEREGQDIDSMPRANVDIQASGDLSNLSTIEDNLAQEIVNIGMEPDTEAAKEAISIQ